VTIFAITRRPSPLLESGERTHIGRDPIDFSLALAQHTAYRSALRELGAVESCLEDAGDFPDGVFIEDTALVLDEAAIMMRPGAASRRPEIAGVREKLAPYRSREYLIGPPATVDGGDIVVLGRHILVGRSERTNAEGIEALGEVGRVLGYKVRPVRMSGCLHLKSGCTALPDGRLLINRRWIDERDVADFTLVDVPAWEPWGGDVAFVGETVVAAAAYEGTLETLRAAGYPVRPVDVSEFAKAEGGVTCMSLIFRNALS
jgi:dimethylargininase